MYMYMHVYVYMHVIYIYNYICDHINIEPICIFISPVPHYSLTQFLSLSWGSLFTKCFLKKWSWKQLGSFSIVQ